MNAEQTAFYEEHGYLVIKAALTPEHVQALNDGYDERVAEAESRTTEDGLTPARRAQLVGQYNFRESRQHLQSGVRLWSAAYEQLVDPPTVMPIVTELLNDDKWGHSSPGVPPPEHRGKVRLDHDNIHFRPGTNPDGGGSLHTGYSGPDCRLLTLVYELKPVAPGQGGFGCIPGSHRPDFPALPEHEGWRKSWATDELRGAAWPANVPVHRIEAEPGSCIIFTEKLLHGTLPWAGGGERRTLFYKYVPYGYHNRDVEYDVEAPGLTPAQREMMAYPEVWYTKPWFGEDRFEEEAPWGLKAVADGGVDSWGEKEEDGEQNGGMPPPSSTAKL